MSDELLDRARAVAAENAHVWAPMIAALVARVEAAEADTDQMRDAAWKVRLAAEALRVDQPVEPFLHATIARLSAACRRHDKAVAQR